MRRGYTLPEIVISLALASILFGLVYAVFTPSQRQGLNTERRLQLAHATILLSSTMERDVQGAEELDVVDGVLVLKRFLSRDPTIDDYGVIEIVRYSHRAGQRVMREVEIKPRQDNASRARKDAAFVGHQRYLTLTFTKREQGTLFDVAGQLQDPDPRAPVLTLAFTLQSQLPRPGSYWVPVEFF